MALIFSLTFKLFPISTSFCGGCNKAIKHRLIPSQPNINGAKQKKSSLETKTTRSFIFFFLSSAALDCIYELPPKLSTYKINVPSSK